MTATVAVITAKKTTDKRNACRRINLRSDEKTKGGDGFLFGAGGNPSRSSSTDKGA